MEKKDQFNLIMNKIKTVCVLFVILNAPSFAIDLLYTEWGTPDIGIVNSNGTKSVYAITSGQQSGPFTTDGQGNLFISDNTNQQIIKVSSSNRSVSTYASGVLFNNPSGLAFDGNGNLFVSNYAWTSGTTVLKINPEGAVSVFANVLGGGSLAYKNNTGEIYVGNYFNSKIDQIDTAGSVTTFKDVGGVGNANSILFDSFGTGKTLWPENAMKTQCLKNRVEKWRKKTSLI